MPTLRQTAHVQPDRRVRLEFTAPDDVPTGEVDVLVVLTPHSDPQERCRVISSLAGCLARNKSFAAGGVAVQREMRDEWQ
jgi:hypothetical protein